jgi:hypothetical protein
MIPRDESGGTTITMTGSSANVVVVQGEIIEIEMMDGMNLGDESEVAAHAATGFETGTGGMIGTAGVEAVFRRYCTNIDTNPPPQALPLVTTGLGNLIPGHCQRCYHLTTANDSKKSEEKQMISFQ